MNINPDEVLFGNQFIAEMVAKYPVREEWVCIIWGLSKMNEKLTKDACKLLGQGIHFVNIKRAIEENQFYYRYEDILDKIEGGK
jgi:hypothetical protein